ncbi:MAG: hypothetical protein GYA24_06925 [Candidatus Lokiarchaeota archaeon]|nr:hypothetical protein [Candidatus Lokiarchaeota archaeon]
MSLDKFVKPVKEQGGPSSKEVLLPAAKEEARQKPVNKAPAKKKTKLTQNATEIEDVEALGDEGGKDVDLVEKPRSEEPTKPKESALKAMGMEKFALACPACKYKKELLIAGEPKPHQLLCKKCGGQMKASKKA